MSESIGEQNIVHSLSVVAPMLLEQSTITLLQLATGNLLLLNFKQGVEVDPMFYLELVPIARLLQKRFGISQICIRDAQQNTILHWSSQAIIEMAELWKI